MDKLSRRKMLTGGAALGAAGVVGMAAPAGARSLWTWKAAGSVAGTGAGTDPKWVWDDLADPVIAAVQERGDVPMVNEKLRSWRFNGQPLPSGLPGDVVDFIEEARRLPTWTDHTKLADAFDFYKTRGLYTGLLYGFNSGMMSTAIPNEARAVYYSKGGADMRDRIAKTAKLGYDIGVPGAYRDTGQMIVTCVKTRMVHASVRHLLPQSPWWPEHDGYKPIPISQADIMVTWHSLATTANRSMTSWPMRIPQRHWDGFLHLWQITAHMLGVLDEYIPNSWNEADSQAKQVLDPVLEATPEGIALAEILLDLAELDVNGDDIGLLTPLRPVLHALTRYFLGDEITDALQIRREPFWDSVVPWAWPRFVALREGALVLPLPPTIYWAFDEILRAGVLVYLNSGRLIHIEMPTDNRTSF